MLFLLSPAKRLDFDPPAVDVTPTTPQFLARSAELIAVLKKLSVADVRGLMNLSDALAMLNVARYGAWRRRAPAGTGKPAVLAFDGDVYGGLAARSFDAAELVWAQRHLAILSGLYGVLRPLDLLQPYRLEMGTRLATSRGADLYAFWGVAIARHLDAVVAADPTPVIVNLASQEYAKVVRRDVLTARVVDCVFEQGGIGGYRVVGLFAKRARGLMARWAVVHRAALPSDLCAFDAEGYAFDRAASQRDRLVFRRAESAR